MKYICTTVMVLSLFSGITVLARANQMMAASVLAFFGFLTVLCVLLAWEEKK